VDGYAAAVGGGGVPLDELALLLVLHEDRDRREGRARVGRHRSGQGIQCAAILRAVAASKRSWS